MQQNKPTIILAVSAVSFPHNNASNNIIYTFMDGFREQGYECEVVCIYPRSKDYPPMEPVGTYNNVKYRYLQSGIRSSHKIVNLIESRIVAPFLFEKYLKALSKRYVVKCLFFTHIRWLFYNISRICHRHKADVIFTACEYPELIIKKNPFTLNLFNQYSKYVDKYIFETKTLEDYYISVTKKPLCSKVVPTTMPCDDILCARKNTAETFISYCGSIASDEKDGLSNIIRAFSTFSEKYVDVKLKFIGRVANQNYYNQLIKLVESLSIKEKVEFTGSVSREEYIQHLVNSSLMVVAKPNCGYYAGGLSSKVVEYLYSGNPIVMTKADDYKYYLSHKENVYFIEDNQPATICEAFIELFNSPSLRMEIGENGKTFALQEFNYHKITENLLDFIL